MGRSILVTGASRGIGFAIAQRFLGVDDVGDLILTARDTPTFSASVAKLRSTNPHGKTISQHFADLTDRAAVTALAAEVIRDHGRVDVLVNNAGVAFPAPLQQLDLGDLDHTMAVNLTAPLLLVRELLRAGNVFDLIVNVASTAGLTGRGGWVAYSASKAALIAASAVMRQELAIYGTRVACVCPGRCATDLRRALEPDEDQSLIMQPEHVAKVIETLASPVGRYIDSQNLVVRLEA